MPSDSVSPFWPLSRQKGRSYAATNLAARACRCRCSDSSRASDTPSTAMSRNGPAGTALTRAAPWTTSPDSRVTAQPAAPTFIDRTGVPSRTRSPSSSAIRSATVAEPSATRMFSHSS